MVITKAQENLIFEINDRPAFEVFVELVGKPFQQDLRRALAFVFVGLPPDPRQTEIEPGQYLVRNIIGLDAQRGILAVAQPVEAGQPLIFTLRDGQRARDDLGQMLERQGARLEGRKPRLGLYFNCCARGSGLYGVPGIDTAYIKQALADVPVIGFFGNYEIGPMAGGNHLLTYTGSAGARHRVSRTTRAPSPRPSPGGRGGQSQYSPLSPRERGRGEGPPVKRRRRLRLLAR